MNTHKLFSGFYSFNGLFAFVLLSLLNASVFAANYPLEIIQPQPNLDIKNRFYKAYPGLEYNVRLAVIGGDFPFRFALTSAPQGMTIDNRGEINWANPVTSGTPYNVTAKVTDAQSKSTNVSWTITVTSSGFRFIDAVNGKSVANGGTGVFTNPWKSMKDMYEGYDYASKRARNYAGEFLYWRTGTYTMDAYKEDNAIRVPLVGDYKPQVWLAYPGEKPVIDMAGAQLSIYSGGSNTYFDGLEFNINGNARGMGISIDSSANNATFRRNKLHNITNGYTGGNNALIFITRDTVGSYYSFQDNEFWDVFQGYGLLGYSASHVLFENNKIHQIFSGHAVSPKEGTQMWFIRSNRMYDNSDNDGNSINVQYSNSGGIQSGDIEISYNIVEAGGGKVRINSNYTAGGLPVYIFRNTFMDVVNVNKVTSNNGVFKFYDNVIINGIQDPNKILRKSIEDASNLVVTNNLTGSAADNIVDAQGYLTSNYSTYVGQRGYQLGKRPLPPKSFTVN